MDKFQSTLEKYLLPTASKIQSNVYVSAVADGFAKILPIIIMGAIFMLLASLQIAPYQAFLELTGLRTIFSFASTVTTDLLAIYVVYGISWQLTAQKGHEQEASFVAPIAIAMFLLTIPGGVSIPVPHSTESTFYAPAISTAFLGTRGLFSAIIIGVVVPSIYLFFVKRNIVIKMPASVPPTISKSFSSLIPGFAILFLFSLVRFVFGLTHFGDFNSFIYEVISEPLSVLGTSPIAFLIFIFVAQLLWFFGIHGYMVIRPFVQVIFLPFAVENLSAYAAGEPLPHAITFYHYGTYVSLGGDGALLGLAIMMAFFARSQRYKTLGKLGLPSTFCRINEPIIFGSPIVLNPIFFVPFIVTPLISFIIPYFLQMVGILPYLRGVVLPLGTPALLYGWLQGGVPVMLMQVVLIILQMIIYFPFFRMADKQALAEESALSEDDSVMA
ncbi:MAG: PTS transporter subunit EIIC [Firmicutes bacterium]|nr:PTS transporter subunit EIIC [Bacillota bacterium]